MGALIHSLWETESFKLTYILFQYDSNPHLRLLLFYFHKPALISELLILKASVNYVGETSMEIGVKAECESLLTGEIKHIASAYLTMVAIERGGKPKKIGYALELETDEDRRRHAEAIERKKARSLIREAKNKREYNKSNG